MAPVCPSPMPMSGFSSSTFLLTLPFINTQSAINHPHSAAEETEVNRLRDMPIILQTFRGRSPDPLLPAGSSSG